MRDTAGNVITESSFYVGAEITIHGHCFRVTSADDKTLRLMEERAANDFIYSDPSRATEILANWIDGHVDEANALLKEGDFKV